MAEQDNEKVLELRSPLRYEEFHWKPEISDHTIHSYNCGYCGELFSEGDFVTMFYFEDGPFATFFHTICRRVVFKVMT